MNKFKYLGIVFFGIFATTSCIYNVKSTRVTAPDTDFMRFISDRTVKVKVRYRCVPVSTGAVKYFTVGGSGVILKSYKGISYIMTAAHVVEEKRVYSSYVCHRFKTRVERYSLLGTKIDSFSVKVVKTDDRKDLALLAVLKSLGVNTKIAKRATLGQNVHSLGFPAVLANRTSRAVLVYTHGNLNILSLPYKGKDLIRISSKIYFGNSGGPIFDDRGRVLGISVLLFSSYKANHSEYYATSFRSVRDFLWGSPYRFLLE